MADKTVTVRLQALTDQYRASMAQATASTRVFGAEAIKTARKNHESLQQVGIAGLAFGGALAFGLKQAADAAIEFESSFAGVRKTVDGTPAELLAISDGLRDMATEIPVNVNELNRIAESAGQLGIAKTGILAFTEVIAKLGATTDLAGEEGATGLAQFANIMQTAEGDFDQLGSTLVALGNKGASTERQILDMALRIAGAGQLIGLTEDQVLGVAAALSDLGIPAEMGGTAISRTFLTISDVVATGGEDLERFADVAGMSVERFSTLFEQDAARATVAFVEGLGRIDASGGNLVATLRDLGLGEVRVRDTLLRLSGAGRGMAESLDLASDATRDNNALQDEFAKRADTTASKVQIATNKINDAAISFGEILLPAIAAGAGALGDFAAGIGDLPGPLRTAVIVVIAAAAAMGILVFASTLLVDRLRLARLAMFEVTGTASLMKGSLILALRSINPLTVGITAATFGIGLFITAHHEARQRVEDFTQAIMADSGAIGENTRQVAINELAKADLFDVAEQFGIDQATLTDAALGEADALAEVTGAIEAYRSSTEESVIAGKAGEVAITGQEMAARQLERGLGILGGAIDESKVMAEDHAAAMGKDAEQTGEVTTTADRYKDALVELNPEMEETGNLADTMREAFERLAGANLDVEETAIRWLDSIADMRETLSENAKTLDINTEAGRENREALLKSIHAAIENGAAIANQSGELNRGVRLTRDHIQALADQAIEAGISEEAVRNYIEQLGLTPAEIRTILELKIEEAQTAIDQFIRTNDGRVIGLRIVTEGGFIPHQDPDLHHAGGIAGATGARRMHGGGVAGLPPMRSNEVLAILERGEGIISAPAMQAGAQAQAPAAVAAVAPVHNHITVQVGDQKVAEMVVDALRGVILKEAV